MKIVYFEIPHVATAIIVGSNGMIGGAVTSLFSTLGGLPHHRKTLEVNHRDASKAIEYLLPFCANPPKGIVDLPIYIVYACGKGGFSVNKEITEQQTLSLSLLIETLSHQNMLGIRLIYLSSLGAHLSSVDSHYKSMVGLNEEIVRSYANSLIIRLPGIWGFKKQNNAWTSSGLIAHLLNSAITRREALIYGDLATTRHYLSSNTVGSFIANIIRYEDWEQDFKTLNLYSLALLSISDIISVVNREISRKVIYRLFHGALVDRENLIRNAFDGKGVNVVESLVFELRVGCLKLQQAYQ